MILDIVHVVLLLGGAGFMLAAIVGFLRFRESLARLHAVGVAGTAGFSLIVLARAAHAATPWAVVEYLVILALGVVASATVAQALAWAGRTHPAEDCTDGDGWPARGERGRDS